MTVNLLRKFAPSIWQVGFILLATTWLWAPQLNHLISSRTSLISQYEVPGQPYAWLFRLGDIVGATLLLIIPMIIRARRKLGLSGWLLMIVAAGLLLDPVIPTSCQMVGDICREYTSTSFISHAIDTVIQASAIFVLGLYDYAIRKRLVSLLFVVFQILYGLLFVSQLASNNQFNTASQYVYQTVLVLWLAWYVRQTFWQDRDAKTDTRPSSLIRNSLAVWALGNGFLAVLVSLFHIHLFGNIHGVYFAGDNAWLAQHGVVVGVIMIYLSRHLARGERRARQIFLLITAVEVLKYSVVTPQPLLLALYLLTFCALFLASRSFERGPVNLTLEIRLKDAAYLVIALLIAVMIALSFLTINKGRAEVTKQSIDQFFDYTVRSKVVSVARRPSALLAHTSSAFLLAGAGSLLWILFKPQPLKKQLLPEAEIRRLLQAYSNSSEDYFKLWPADKDYFRLEDGDGFIAYKVVGPIAFGLADPIAADDNQRQKLLESFVRMCRDKDLRACFLPVVQPNLKLYKTTGLREIQIGATALINIDNFLQNTARDKWWRWKTNRAVKAGYQYQFSQPPHSPNLLRQMKQVSQAWLGYRGRQEYGLTMGHFDSSYLSQTPVDYLQDRANNLVAFTNQLPQFQRGDITTIDLLRYLPDANDAMPYLLLKTIDRAKAGGQFKYFDLGFVPFAKAKGPILAIARSLGAGRFSAKGLEQFKNKFDPDWQPVYMTYDGDLGDLALIAVNLEKAMSLI